MSTPASRDKSWQKLKARVARFTARFRGERGEEATEPVTTGNSALRPRETQETDKLHRTKEREVTRSRSHAVLGKSVERHTGSENKFIANVNGPHTMVGYAPQLRKSKSSPLVRFDDRVQIHRISPDEQDSSQYQVAKTDASASSLSRSDSKRLSQNVRSLEKQKVLSTKPSTASFRLIKGHHPVGELSPWDREIAIRNIERFERLNKLGCYKDSESLDDTRMESGPRRDDAKAVAEEQEVEEDKKPVNQEETLFPESVHELLDAVSAKSSDESSVSGKSGFEFDDGLHHEDMSVEDLTEYVAAMELRLQEFRGVHRSVSNALENLPPLDIAELPETVSSEHQSKEGNNSAGSVLDIRIDIAMGDGQTKAVVSKNALDTSSEQALETPNAHHCMSGERTDLEPSRTSHGASQVQPMSNFQRATVVSETSSPTSSDDRPLGIDTYLRNGGFSLNRYESNSSRLREQVRPSSPLLGEEQRPQLRLEIPQNPPSAQLEALGHEVVNEVQSETTAVRRQSSQTRLPLFTPVRRSEGIATTGGSPNANRPPPGTARSSAVPISSLLRSPFPGPRLSRSLSAEIGVPPSPDPSIASLSSFPVPGPRTVTAQFVSTNNQTNVISLGPSRIPVPVREGVITQTPPPSSFAASPQAEGSPGRESQEAKPASRQESSSRNRVGYRGQQRPPWR